MPTSSPRVLVISRNYPNVVDPLLGVWVERPTAVIGRRAETVVVAPVPWSPPLPSSERLARFRRYRTVPEREFRFGVEVHHPRYVVGPRQRMRAHEARSYYWRVRHLVHRMHRFFPFDVIHAHFLYPDGVVAARLGRDLALPVVVTDHVPWTRYLDVDDAVRTQALAATRGLACHVAVSQSVADQIVAATGDGSRVRVVPNGVDESVFRPLERDELAAADPNRIVFVGHLRPVKGLDVLLDAMEIVAARLPAARLLVVGDALYPSSRGYVAEIRASAGRPSLHGRVEFCGAVPPTEVARLVAGSALLVLPGRSESFGTVLVEALACGVPVLATRCGGPEDIIVPEVGKLVPVEDPSALADGIVEMMSTRQRYRPHELRAYAVEHFSYTSVADRMLGVYADVTRRSSSVAE